LISALREEGKGVTSMYQSGNDGAEERLCGYRCYNREKHASSKTSPLPLLETWRVEFGLQFEIWTDTNYKANYYYQVPSFILDKVLKAIHKPQVGSPT
jgi:hypothetical protein